jgi:hypothetical protein
MVGTLTAGAKAAKVSTNTVYLWREDGEFCVREQQAKESFADQLEQEAVRRAWHGNLKPVYQAGIRVGFIREYSDTLLIFLLKANRPDKYRERVDFSFKAQEAAKDLAAQLGLDPQELLQTAADIASGHSDQLVS